MRIVFIIIHIRVCILLKLWQNMKGQKFVGMLGFQIESGMWLRFKKSFQKTSIQTNILPFLFWQSFRMTSKYVCSAQWGQNQSEVAPELKIYNCFKVRFPLCIKINPKFKILWLKTGYIFTLSYLSYPKLTSKVISWKNVMLKILKINGFKKSSSLFFIVSERKNQSKS